MQTPVATFNCPSRRTVAVYPISAHLIPRNASLTNLAARNDYAINEGDYGRGAGEGPPSYEAGDSPTYKWPDTSQFTGIGYVRSQVRVADVSDGMSNTYLVGEKYVDPARALTGRDPGDDQCAFVGADWDVNRWATKDFTPMLDRAGPSEPRRFGSSHPDGCNFVLCDGSVRVISYGIDGEIHRRMGNRRDGLPLSIGSQ